MTIVKPIIVCFPEKSNKYRNEKKLGSKSSSNRNNVYIKIFHFRSFSSALLSNYLLMKL